MNCKICNNLLEPRARFCPRCGTTIEGNISLSGVDHTFQAPPAQSESGGAEATLITPKQSLPLVINPQTFAQGSQLIEQTLPPWEDYSQPGGPPLYIQPQASVYPQQGQSPLSTQPMEQTQLPQWGSFSQPGGPTSYTPPQAPLYLKQEPTVPFVQYQTNQAGAAAQFPSVGMDTQRQKGKRARRPRLGGCLIRLVLVLVLLLAASAAAWFFALRPYVHGIAENELDNALTDAVNRIPPALSQLPLPPNTQLPAITESMLKNIIILNTAPADPLQDPAVHINQEGVRIEFTLHENFLFDFNFPCAVTLTPALDNQGNLVAHNVSIEGIASLVMSPDELTTLINQKLAQAQQKLNHPIASVQLQQGEIVVVLQ